MKKTIFYLFKEIDFSYYALKIKLNKCYLVCKGISREIPLVCGTYYESLLVALNKFKNYILVAY